MWHGSHVHKAGLAQESFLEKKKKKKNPSLTTSLFVILFLTPIVQSTKSFLTFVACYLPLSINLYVRMSARAGSISIHSSSSYEDHTMCPALRKQNQKTTLIHSRISQSGRLLNILTIIMPCDHRCGERCPGCR